jgi:hypothetical protein
MRVCVWMLVTQLRCTASFLNHDLYKVHILSSPTCSCDAPQEDANHFFQKGTIELSPFRKGYIVVL